GGRDQGDQGDREPWTDAGMQLRQKGRHVSGDRLLGPGKGLRERDRAKQKEQDEGVRGSLTPGARTALAFPGAHCSDDAPRGRSNVRRRGQGGLPRTLSLPSMPRGGGSTAARGWRTIAVMAYDEDIANRIRELIAGQRNVTEKKMFGGLAFLVGGNMA